MPCSHISEGCTECAVGADNAPSECLACANRMDLEDNECTWTTCDEYTTLDDHGRFQGEARCMDCADGYGLSEGDCFQCFVDFELWDNCNDCSVQDGVPHNCIECSGPTVLVASAETAPANTCQPVFLTNCD